MSNRRKFTIQAIFEVEFPVRLYTEILANFEESRADFFDRSPEGQLGETITPLEFKIVKDEIIKPSHKSKTNDRKKKIKETDQSETTESQ